MSLKICIAGAIASGKTTVCDTITGELSCGKFSFSAVLKEHLLRVGVSPNRENLQNLGESLIKEKGAEGFMKWIVDNAPVNVDKSSVLIDGFRHPKIFSAFKKMYPQATLVFCDCSLDEQIRRITSRDNISEEQAKSIISHPVEKEVSMLKQFSDIVFNENSTSTDIRRWIGKLSLAKQSFPASALQRKRTDNQNS